MSHQLFRTLVASAAIVVSFACGGSKAAPSTQASDAAAAIEPVIESVINGSFVVPPRNFKPFEVLVAANMVRPRIEGTFSASGANNDIEVLLLDESQFQNWQNRHEFKATYASGRVTADKMRIELPNEPGKYFIIFSNRFSIFSNKGVVADVKLRYDRAM